MGSQSDSNERSMETFPIGSRTTLEYDVVMEEEDSPNQICNESYI